VYAPEKDSRELVGDGDLGLTEELDEHLKKLIKIPSENESELSSSTRTQLENMGYM